MSKTKVKFVCQACGHDSPKWLGRCPGCGEWNSMCEEIVRKKEHGLTALVSTGAGKPCLLSDVDIGAVPRRETGIAEFDRVLGGGIVPGALLLIGGDPGIGKSTLLLQVATGIGQRYGTVLYVSGEESAAQTRLRAERLGALGNKLLVMTETNLDMVLTAAVEYAPVFLVIDSIQTMFCPEIPSAPGTVSQVRESTGRLLRFAKESGVATAIIGHVTKDGNIAGPRLLEHMVDVVLYFEGERSYAFRVLRAMKNRFGSTNESGLFAMEESGLVEVDNPSGVLLAERPRCVPGSAVLACMEGVRPLLIEVQALVSTTCFGMPRRMAVGFDGNRLILLLAVLEKRVGLALGNQDAYVNAVGGLKVAEPAADLPVVLALVSSFRNKIIAPDTVVLGEVGLTGEVRMVGRMEQRIQEAVRLGFKRFVIPAGNLPGLKINRDAVEVVGVSNVIEAMEEVFV